MKGFHDCNAARVLAREEIALEVLQFQEIILPKLEPAIIELEAAKKELIKQQALTNEDEQKLVQLK